MINEREEMPTTVVVILSVAITLMLMGGMLMLVAYSVEEKNKRESHDDSDVASDQYVAGGFGCLSMILGFVLCVVAAIALICVNWMR